MKRLKSELELDNDTTDRLAYDLSLRSYLPRRILLRTPPNDFPRFLYKYLDPSIPDEWLRDLLIDSKLYLKSPADFNDPFDMKGCIVDEPKVQKKRAHIDTLVKQKAQHLNWKQRKAKVDSVMSDPDLFEKLKKSLIEVIEKHGISCFSTEPRSILMWSHYAQHHKGIALQFEYARDVISFQYILPIKYRKDYPTIEYYGDRRLYTEFILGKYKDWSYEDEWRLVKHESANTYHSFDSKALTGIILGCRIDNREEERIRATIAERERMGLGRINLCRAELHESKYQLVIRRARAVGQEALSASS